MHIEIEKTDDKDDWTVRLGRYQVPFTSQVGAEAFVEQLQARLQAPHPWPANSDESSAAQANIVPIVGPAGS